jgi:LmbE family N-acetylglucosaminyl deacetylase
VLTHQEISVKGYRIVAISPHFDDVALSMGGHIVAAGVSTAIVTVHGGPPPAGLPPSEWDADCGFASPDAAFATRLSEDAESCRAMGASRRTLPNADGPYRDDDLPLAGLDELIRAAAVSADLYLPAGINQPDHRRVRDQAIAALAGQPDVRPFFYADLPYTSAIPGWFELDDLGLASSAACPEHVRELERVYPAGLALVRRTVLTGHTWDRKRQAVLHHASQLALVAQMAEVAALRPLLALDGLLTVEAVWRPRTVAG